LEIGYDAVLSGVVMQSDDRPTGAADEPNDSKQPWQQPVIEFVNLGSSEADGGAAFDGTVGSS
jgi:hypothetical protein